MPLLILALRVGPFCTSMVDSCWTGCQKPTNCTPRALRKSSSQPLGMQWTCGSTSHRREMLGPLTTTSSRVGSILLEGLNDVSTRFEPASSFELCQCCPSVPGPLEPQA